MAASLSRTVENFLRAYDVCDQGVIVGVSGGADSLALLHSLLALHEAFRLRLQVAHLNHQLRGDESEADACFVEELAREWGLPATVESHDVAAFAALRRLSTEEAARLVRYGFLEQVAEREGAQVVVVAHHADDQVETILMHFLRGAGLAGLRGMLPSTTYPFKAPVRLLRPLLDVTRAEIEAYCAEQQLTPRVDHTNADTGFLRNRVRHELLPLLEQYNPNLRAVLRQNARVLADDYDYLAERARGAYERTLLVRSDDSVAFALSGWRVLQPSLKRALVRLAVAELRPEMRKLDARHVDDALYVADGGRVGARAALPDGLWLFRGVDSIVFAERLVLPELPEAPVRAASLPVPGQVHLENGWVLEARTLPQEELPADALKGIDPLEAFFDAERMPGELTLRAREPGDRFAPLGMKGQRKLLRRFMMDAKVPEAWRARTPLVVAGDEVIWIAGWRIAEAVKVTAQTRQILHLRFMRDAG